MEINGVGVTLTKKQLNEITNKRNKSFDFKIIKSFEDACNRLIIPINNDISNIAKLGIIIKSINNGWEPDFDDPTEEKYCPYFSKNFDFPLNFSLTYSFTNSDRILPLGLYLESGEKAEYVGRTFIKLYTEL